MRPQTTAHFPRIPPLQKKPGSRIYGQTATLPEKIFRFKMYSAIDPRFSPIHPRLSNSPPPSPTPPGASPRSPRFPPLPLTDNGNYKFPFPRLHLHKLLLFSSLFTFGCSMSPILLGTIRNRSPSSNNRAGNSSFTHKPPPISKS